MKASSLYAYNRGAIYNGIIGIKFSMVQNNKSGLIIGALLVALVIVSVLFIQAKHDLRTVLAEGRSNITALRDEIDRKCTGADADQQECAKVLGELATVLQQFSANLNETATTTTE